MKRVDSLGDLARTGVPGFDEIVRGGLPRECIYLIQGDPGSGKTTLSLQFLLEGARRGERCLYLTLAEGKRELEKVAESHGWNLDSIEIFEQLIGEEILGEEQDTTMFHPSEIELGKTIGTLLAEVERIKPSRVIIDSLSEIRLLSQSPLRYRKQILALKQFFTNRNITVYLIDDKTMGTNDIQLHSVPHGVIILERQAPLYGSARRRIEVVKLRGVPYVGGYHDFDIVKGGVVVFPRLIASEHRYDAAEGEVLSGVPAMDKLVGGGLHKGSSTVIMGPAGAGKSALSTLYAVAAARRGEKTAMFIFDESRKTLFMRSASIGLRLEEQVKNGMLSVQQVDPAELSPGEFAHLVRAEVEENGARIVVIDSLNGYFNAMPEERFLTLHLHELLSYLSDHGVLTLLVVAQHGLIGPMNTAIDVSYLADCVILLRYYEAGGEIHKAVSVLKKRSGGHEKAIRDFSIGSKGIAVGPPLKRFRGILSGVPVVEAPPVEFPPRKSRTRSRSGG